MIPEYVVALHELLCRALKLDPSKVSRLTIESTPDDLPLVRIATFLAPQEGQEIARHLSNGEGRITVDIDNSSLLAPHWE